MLPKRGLHNEWTLKLPRSTVKPKVSNTFPTTKTFWGKHPQIEKHVLEESYTIAGWFSSSSHCDQNASRFRMLEAGFQGTTIPPLPQTLPLCPPSAKKFPNEMGLESTLWTSWTSPDASRYPKQESFLGGSLVNHRIRILIFRKCAADVGGKASYEKNKPLNFQP